MRVCPSYHRRIPLSIHCFVFLALGLRFSRIWRVIWTQKRFSSAPRPKTGLFRPQRLMSAHGKSYCIIYSRLRPISAVAFNFTVETAIESNSSGTGKDEGIQRNEWSGRRVRSCDSWDR